MRITIPDLAPGVGYNIQFRAKSLNAVSEWSRTFQVQASGDTIAPRMPTNFAGERSGDSFKFVWSAVEFSEDGQACNDLDHYKVKIVNLRNNETVIYKTIDTKFDFTFDRNRSVFGTPSPNIRVCVAASDKTGNTSDYTDAVTLNNPPPPPVTDLVAASGINLINVKWSPVVDPDGDFKDYKVYVDSANNFSINDNKLAWRGAASSYAMDSDNFNSDLWIAVTAVDKFEGESSVVYAGPVRPRSSYSVDTAAPEIPGGLTGSITTGEVTFASLSWTPIQNAGNDLQNYVVQYRKEGTSEWVAAAPIDKDTTTAKITPLEAYANYDFKIKAVDFSANNSGYSNTVRINGATAAAPAKIDGVVLSGGMQTATVTFTRSADNNVSHYEIEFDSANTFDTAGKKQSTTASTLESFVNLISDTTYYTRVRAVSKQGLKGVWSDIASGNVGIVTAGFSSDGNAPSTSPTPIVTAGIGYLFVSWDKVANNDPVTYEIHIGTTAGFTVNSASMTGSVAGGTMAVVKTLPNDQPLAYGVEYFIKIVARDEDGAAAASNSVSGQIKKVLVEDFSVDVRQLGVSKTFYQDDTPTGQLVAGDLWVDTNDGNKLYIYDAGQWKTAQDASIANALAAANAKTKVTTQANPPSNPQINDVWIDSGNGNTIKVWDGNAWITRRDQIVLDAANSKNKIVYSSSDAAGTNFSAGDTWFKTDANGIVLGMWKFVGTTWEPQTIGNTTIANIDAGKITSGFIAADRIAANSITGAKIAAGTITANEMMANTITAASGIIADAAITSAMIQSLRADKISGGFIDANVIEAGAITIGQIKPGDVATPGYVAAKGTDLVVNGTGYLENNYNFSTYTYQPADAPEGCVGSFETADYNATKWSDEYIPIDPEKKWRISVKVKQRGAAGAKFYYGLAPFDAFKNPISPENWVYKPGTLTTLAANLNPGDTQVVLTSASGWDNSGSAAHNKSFIFWNYVDPAGKAWAENTYSRNIHLAKWGQGSISGNTITLLAPWNGPAIPSGTKVSNTNQGANYLYVNPTNVVVPQAWTTYGDTFSGIANGDTSTSQYAKFPPGCANVKFLALVNREVAGSIHAIAGVSISDAAAAQTILDGWTYPGSTTINGGKIQTQSITALQIQAGAITADSGIIANAAITNAMINSLDANKITADSTFTSNLGVKSTFTLGDATTDGVIQSFGYSPTTGFKIAKSGLIINEGTIAARALNIQIGQNMAPAQFADFEWASATYATDWPGSNYTGTIVAGGAKYGQQYLQLRKTVAADGEAYMGASSSDYNISVDAGETYIMSVWVKGSGVDTEFRMRVRYNTGTFSALSASTNIVANSGWQRISTTLVIPAGVTAVIPSFYTTTTTTNSGWDIDGLQFERQLTAVTTPSPWNPPSQTVINGGQIRTGEIRSSQLISVNGVNQPAWSINTAGNMQIGDALVRGSVRVGLADGTASKIYSDDYLAGVRGWIIRSDGFAEFRNLAINSITVSSLAQPIKNTLGTKLSDYMEDVSLWSSIGGTVVGKTNDITAYSAKALLEISGNTFVVREVVDGTTYPSAIAFEPEQLYRVTCRLRQKTMPENGSAPIASIGFMGLDDNKQIVGWDGGSNGFNSFFFAGHDVEVPMATTTTDDTGWQTYIGYFRGRSATPSWKNTPDPYNPGQFHDKVKYFSPAVWVNKNGDSSTVCQIDSFTVETYDAGAQQKLSTDTGNGQRNISIQSIESESSIIDHAIRLYEKTDSEYAPGVIAQYSDLQNNMVIAPSIVNKSKWTNNYSMDSITITSRSQNLLANSNFANGFYGWANVGGVTLATDSDPVKMRSGGTAAKFALTGTGVPATMSLTKNVYLQDYTWIEPDKVDKIGFSGWINSTSMVNTTGCDIEIIAWRRDENGTETQIFSALENASNHNVFDGMGEWRRISGTVAVPGGLAADTYRLEFIFRRVSNSSEGTSTPAIFVADLQLEFGELTSYRPQNSSSTQVSTSQLVTNKALIISEDGSRFKMPEAKVVYGPDTNYLIADPNDGRIKDPAIVIDSDDVKWVIYNKKFNAYSYSRNALEISAFSDQNTNTNEAHSPRLLLHSLEDDLTPGAFYLLNSKDQIVLATQDKNGDLTKSNTTQDLIADGHLNVKGAPPWTPAPINTSLWKYQNVGEYYPAYYTNNQTVYLRGRTQRAGANVAANSTTPTTIFTLPVGFRPMAECRMMAPLFTGNTMGWCAIRVSTAGVVAMLTPTIAVTQNSTTLALDGLNFSIANNVTVPPSTGTTDTVAPPAPSNLAIAARGSGTSTGSYTLSWTNPVASDLAGVKIVWRSDRYPSMTIPTSGKKTLATDGNIVVVSGTSGQNKSYIHSGIPVNRKIYYRIVAFDSSGNHSGYVSAGRYLLASPITINVSQTGSCRNGSWSVFDGSDTVIQSTWTGGDGHRGLWFYGSQIYDRLNTDGVRRQPTSARINVQRKNSAHGYSAATPARIYSHNYATKPGSTPTINWVGATKGLVRGESTEYVIPNAQYGGMASGAVRGFGLHGNTAAQYFVAPGKTTSSVTGKLTIHHLG